MTYLRSLVTLSAALIFTLLVFTAPAGATPSEPMCSQPSSNGDGPVASDCLFILKVAVGLESCSPECICAPKGTLPTSASDALLCLNFAVGAPVMLDCPCDGGGGGGSGEPIDPREVLGIVTAAFTKNAQADPPLLTVQKPGGTVATPTEEMDLGAVFAIFDTLPVDPDSTTTVEEIAGCTVVTFEQSTGFGAFGVIPDFTPLDPGSPGTADNGSVEIDLIAQGFGGFEANADPLQEGYDAGQTIMFSWPGGADINAFSDSITVPGEVDILTPDLTDPGFDLVAGQALNVSWVPDPDDDGSLSVTASTTISETIFDISGVTINTTSITVNCEFSDAGGSGTMPAAAMAELQSSAPLTATFSKSFSVSRANTKLVEVSPTVMGRDTVGFFASSSAAWATTQVGFPVQSGMETR